MSNPSHPSDDLSELRQQARLNQLRLKIARQNEALSTLRRSGHRDTLEGYYDPANYFDPRDYLFETPRFAGAVPSTLNDRDEGRNYPIFRTEQDLALIRGAARWLSASNPIALGVLTSLTNYVIGNGFQYAAAARSAAGKQLAATANAVIDEFLDENDWSGDLDRELFQRSRIDGEYFLGLWHVGDGHVQARTIEPDQVTEPTNKSGLEEWLGCSVDLRATAQRAGGFVSNWGFGVHTHEVDAQAVHGFYVQWSNRDTDWDYFPGGNEPIVPPDGAGMWLEHAKLNVVRSVKRGLSDFYPIDGNLELARRVLRNMGEGSAVQAAIAWIQEVAPGTTQAQVHSGTLSRADGSYSKLTQQGSRAQATQHYDPATILKVPSGQKYLPGPLGTQHAPNFITAAEALLRTVALRWNLPENLITGSAANNNFASALVAETPFVKYAESQQQFYAQRDRKTLWRVLRFAWQAGRFGEVPWHAVKRSLDVTVTPPQVEVRDPEKETKVRQMLNAAGVLSKKTWSAQESLDFEQEQKNLEQETASNNKAQATTGNNSASASQDARAEHEPPKAIAPESNAHADGVPAESMEAWDAAKHPRGGHPDNRGWFSKVFGSRPARQRKLRTANNGRRRSSGQGAGGATSTGDSSSKTRSAGAVHKFAAYPSQAPDADGSFAMVPKKLPAGVWVPFQFSEAMPRGYTTGSKLIGHASLKRNEDGSLSVDGKLFVQEPDGFTWLATPNDAELAMWNWARTKDDKYLKDPSLASAAQTGFLAHVVDGLNDPRAATRRLIRGFGAGPIVAGMQGAKPKNTVGPSPHRISGSEKRTTNEPTSTSSVPVGKAVGSSRTTSRLRPGPFATKSIPARGSSRNFTSAERAQINKIGQEHGCHSCGSKNPGTASGNFIPDHQPPSQLVLPGQSQKLYPHCAKCSQIQGGQVRAWQQ